MNVSPKPGLSKLSPQLDHLVFGTQDIEAGIEHVECLLGVRAQPGGRHPAWGTRNALIALGERSYLEIVGPDPDQPRPFAGRPFGVDQPGAPRLTTWAVRGRDLYRVVKAAAASGLDLGSVHSGSRVRPDGVRLSWRLTDPTRPRFDGIAPFFIDWGTSPHPAADLPRRCALIGLRAEHPEAGRVQAALHRLGLELAVAAGAKPKLFATIEGPRGVIEL